MRVVGLQNTMITDKDYEMKLMKIEEQRINWVRAY